MVETILLTHRRRNLQSVVDLARLTEVFLVNPNVRYIGVVDKHDDVLFSKMREGIATVNPGHADEEMVSVYPPLIMRAIERLEPILGDAQSVGVSYGNAFLAFYSVLGFLVVVSFNPIPEAPLLAIRVGDEIRKMF